MPLTPHSSPLTSNVIAVDGPGGVGKGTLCRRLAQTLGWDYLDSGALYRLLAYRVQQTGTAPLNAARLVSDLHIRFDLDSNEVYLDGEPVAAAIRTETVGALASQVAVHEDVRAALLDWQRQRAVAPGLVADGRDMGTVVFPDAPLKFFLEASADERARRRYEELRAVGKEAILEKIYREICERDKRDRERSIAPLVPAEDARVIDTTTMSIDQVFDTAMDAVVQCGLSAR